MIYRFLDIETYCEKDLVKVGMKNYIQDSTFEIILVGWVDLDETFNYSNIGELMIHQQEFTQIDWAYFEKGFKDNNITLVAHNAVFEVSAFEKVLGVEINMNRVVDTMTRSYQMNFPGSLSKLSKCLNLQYGKLEGTALINFFSKPRKPTKNDSRTRNLPRDNPGKWDEYKNYNAFDIKAMIEAWYRVLQFHKPTDFENRLQAIDYKINNKGLKIDTQLVDSAIKYIDAYQQTNKERLIGLTVLENPNSNSQFLAWLRGMINHYALDSVDKNSLIMLVEYLNGKHYKYDKENKEIILEAIKLKQALNKTSLKKYNSLDLLMYKGKVYNTLAFEATGTGRWAGRGYQIHNLPKNKLGDTLDQIRESYKNKSRPITESLPYELSQLLRTVIVPDHSKSLIISDYSAIECRVAAWICGEKWVLESFKSGKDIYKSAASQMFEVPYEEVTKNLRQDGKVSVLAGGYGGGLRAFQVFAPDWDDNKAQTMVDVYRAANPHIVAAWKLIERAAKHSINNKASFNVAFGGADSPIFRFKYWRGCLVIELPSQREIYYPRAKVQKVQNGNLTFENITYESPDSLTRKWGVTATYGGKLLENITQAVARDILANAIVKLHDKDWDILFHVHDEIICQMPTKDISMSLLDNYNNILCDLPDWAKGLPMKAEGFFSPYYLKEE